MSKKISSGLTAIAFIAALMLAGAAEAGPLTDTAGPEDSTWSLAWAWLTEVWGDLTGLHDATAPGSFEMNGVSEDGTCGGTCTTNDHGWGIDPNGNGSGG